MKESFARKNQQRSLPEGTDQIADCFKDPAQANKLLLTFFESLTGAITIKSKKLEEWDLISEFVNKVAALQEDYLNMNVSNLNIDVLEYELDEFKAEFDRRLNQIRGIEPKDSQTRAVQKATTAAVQEQIIIHDIPEPTAEDLAEEEVRLKEDQESFDAFLKNLIETEEE